MNVYLTESTIRRRTDEIFVNVRPLRYIIGIFRCPLFKGPLIINLFSQLLL